MYLARISSHSNCILRLKRRAGNHLLIAISVISTVDDALAKVHALAWSNGLRSSTQGCPSTYICWVALVGRAGPLT